MKESKAGEVDPGVEARALELTEKMLRLASKVELAEQFLASAAHELKTPLANLRGELQLALMRPRSPSEYREAIDSALGHTELLLNLTNDLLMFAKITYTSAPRDHDQCDLRSIVLDALEIAAQGLDVETRVSIEVPEDLSIEGRPEELTRLFRNLLENALLYAPADARISVEAECQEDIVVVSLEDGGPPLRPDLAEALFLPFRRGTAKGNGFGLGLSIARAIARSHGGDLALDGQASHPRFLVTLPWRSANFASAVLRIEP